MEEKDFVIPDNIGRNDPCPCGSGKKYKKCHYKMHRVEKEAQKTTLSVQQIVDSKTSPWDMYKIFQMIESSNVGNLVWELSHDQSPFREKYPTMESYLSEIANGTQRLPATPAYELLRFRHDGPDVLLLLVQGADDPKMQSVRAEIITLRPNQIDKDRKLREASLYGYRIWSIDYKTAAKSDLKEEPTFEDFGIKWNPAWDAPKGWFPPIPTYSTQKEQTSPALTQFAKIDSQPAENNISPSKFEEE